ncbi:DUF3889 domain-containing protein [Niallia endozanthoxylica]|uniref:DUF3889 domain-containing protein n=1 Tax=Niallia endozanthoxylica TaxID=2036016 RepID=A0A5J5HLP4_9BACI|nr:DUF3889 domain-containing protein [Niallia endozanthoxylica]KAA9021754.1 DUF3889 domain-containing protein [Niallia endozanthoxylica]
MFPRHPYYDPRFSPSAYYSWPSYQNHPYETRWNPSLSPYIDLRQQSTKGQASWTNGGAVTQCNIPWSDNEYMTASVGTNSPYTCGQTLKIRNLSAPSQKEILVKVVDQVKGYPANKINLHRKAFEALGSNPNVGVINVEITPSPAVEQEEWGRYLLTITQAAYPGYRVTDYRYIGKSTESSNRTKQSYEFMLQSPQETMKVQGNVFYDPNTNRVISFDLNELQ